MFDSYERPINSLSRPLTRALGQDERSETQYRTSVVPKANDASALGGYVVPQTILVRPWGTDTMGEADLHPNMLLLFDVTRNNPVLLCVRQLPESTGIGLEIHRRNGETPPDRTTPARTLVLVENRAASSMNSILPPERWCMSRTRFGGDSRGINSVANGPVNSL